MSLTLCMVGRFGCKNRLTITLNDWAIGNSGNGNWKQKMEVENGSSQNLMQMNARVKPMINDNLLKTTSVQRLPLYKDHVIIISQIWQMTEAFLLKRPPFNRFHLQYLFLNPRACCHCLEKILFYVTGEILIRTNMWKTYYHKEDIPGAYTFYTYYSRYV